MTMFIEDELDPWFIYANTDGPCQEFVTKENSSTNVFIGVPFPSTDPFHWEGFVDDDGNACGEGVGTSNDLGTTVKGTFWKNAPYGTMTFVTQEG